MKVIVTGFGKFLTNDENPTKEVLKALPKKIEDIDVFPIELPVVFDECFTYLKPFIKDIQPDVILLLGLAAGRTAITPERIAINMKDAKGPDNKGNIPKDEKIMETGNNAYFSTLPLRKIEKTLQQMNLPVSISNTAGLYVCNNIMYHTLHYIDQNKLDILSGFIHVPYSDELKQDEQMFSLPQKDINNAVIEIIKISRKM